MIQLSAKYTATLKDYKDEYQDYLDDEYWIEEEFGKQLWESETDVWDFAEQELNKKKYTGWDATDSSQGNYCRFIWFLDRGVTVGVNVHYTDEGKAAGNMYIKDIKNLSFKTPQLMVAKAPSVKPGTTQRWSDL